MNDISCFRRFAQILPTIAILWTCPDFHRPVEAAQQSETHTLIGVIWNSRVSPTYATDYLGSVAQRHKINHPMFFGINAEQMAAAKKKLSPTGGMSQETPSRGYAFYMRNQFPPSFFAVGFRAVANQAEFEDQINQQKKIQPSQFVTIEGTGDRITLNVVMENLMVPTYFRLDRGFMFHAQDNGLFTMELPDAGFLTMPEARQTRDMIAKFDFDQIPVGLRDIPLMMVRVSAQEQQPDESEALFEFRKAVVEYGLTAAKMILDGTRKAEFALTLLHESRPADLQLDLDVKEDSPFAEALGRMASFDRGLDAATDGTLCTLALQSGPSEELCAVFSQGANLLRSSMNGQGNAAPIVAMLETLASHPSHISGFVSLGLDRAGELVLYGAIAAPNAELVDGGDVLSFDIPSHWFRRIGLPESADDLLPSKLSLRLERSTIRFSFGRSQSQEMLSPAVAARKVEKSRSMTELLTVELQTEPWVTDRGPKHQMIRRLERVIADDPKNGFRSFLDDTLTQNGFAGLSVEFDGSDSRNVRLRASVGDGLGRFIAARYLQTEHVQLKESIAHLETKGPPLKKSTFGALIFGNVFLLLIIILVWWSKARRSAKSNAMNSFERQNSA